MPQTTISVNNMLNRLNLSYFEGKPLRHEVEFVKLSDGSLRKMTVQRRATKSAKVVDEASGTKFKFNLKEKDMLLIEDVDSGEPRAIWIPSIIRYGGMDVIH